MMYRQKQTFISLRQSDPDSRPGEADFDELFLEEHSYYSYNVSGRLGLFQNWQSLDDFLQPSEKKSEFSYFKRTVFLGWLNVLMTTFVSRPMEILRWLQGVSISNQTLGISQLCSVESCRLPLSPPHIFMIAQYNHDLKSNVPWRLGVLGPVWNIRRHYLSGESFGLTIYMPILLTLFCVFKCIWISHQTERASWELN